MPLRVTCILTCGCLIMSLAIGCGDDSQDPATANNSQGSFTVGDTPVGATTPAATNEAPATPAPTAPMGQGMAVDVGSSGNTPFGSCPDEASFTGQVRGVEAEVPNGGEARFENYPEAYDAGIGALLADGPGMDGEAEVSLQITGATVIATSFFSERDNPSRNQTQFWIADAAGSIQIRLPFDDSQAEIPESQVRVGQKISFTAKRLAHDAYGLKVTVAEGFTLDEVNQPVYIWDVDRALTEDDVGKLARITGTIDGSAMGCGGSAQCWPVAFGENTITLRSSTDFPPANGACLTFVGPVGVFQGNVQLDTINFDWLYVYD